MNGEDMAKSRSSISKARSYREIGDFWDTHDLSDYWDQTRSAEFEVDIQSEAIYYPVEPKLSSQIASIAKRRGVSPETLLNLWLQEKIGEEVPVK
jgi:hypothetical protein